VESLVQRRDHLEKPDLDAIRAESVSWSAEHALEALPEQAVFALSQGPPIRHLLGEIEGSIVYAQGQTSGTTLEFVTLCDRAPVELVDAALGCAEDVGLAMAIWTRHVAPQSSPPLCEVPLRLDREILQLIGGLGPRQQVEVPAGLNISGFEPGVDDDELLELNRRSFAAHPEQGAMSPGDLELRCRQPWFDPEGLLVVREGGRMVGFCWTKVHRQPWGDIGEIYVIGVDPDVVGRGIGRLAVEVGLDHLARRGLSEVMLYVEADNVAAIGLYASLGLTEAWRDRRWTSGTYDVEAPTSRPTP
jgi:mycothiol synthase